MGSFRKIAAALAGWLVLSSTAFGYYHYVHYATRTAPFTPIYEKFDLNALSNKTLYYFLPDQPGVQLGPGDSVVSVLSQIRAAAKVWNDVGTSDLRLAYGGSANTGLPQTTPGVDVIFDELPPGLLAQGAPIRKSGVNGSGSSPFIPVTRSVVQFSANLTQQPSYGDDFFLTAVHEFGHALGLQHTFTSATMSTKYTRSTTKADPLDADDIAGISLLYPAASFRPTTASITGRVTSGSQGVNLASVVAISPNGSAISALTNPDGTYRIDGIPAGNYYVYVHPLPLPESGETTPGNVSSQWDPDGNQSFAFSVGPVSFSAQFFPNAKDWHAATQFSFAPGQSFDGLNFNVQRIARNPFNSIYAYGFPGGYAVQPPFINFNGGRQLIAAGGNGLIVNGVPAPGLNVSVLGGLATGSPRAYTSDYLLIDFQESLPAPPEGERHMVFSVNNEIYVLPAAFHAVHKQPPQIFGIFQSFDATGRSTLILNGANLASDTVVMFDGQPATVTEVLPGALRVIPPSAPSGQRSTVVALNSDGQTSMFLQAPAPPTYQYDTLAPGADSAFLNVSTNALVPGAETMLEVNTFGRPFADGATVLGFGSSDVVVRRSWITNNGSKILANVYVSPDAASAFLNLSVFSGLRGLTLPYALQTLPPAAPVLSLSSSVINFTWNNTSVIPGSTVMIPVPNLTAAAIQNGLTLTVGGVPVTNFTASPGQIAFTVPNVAAGPEVVRLQTATELASIVVQVDNSPASVFALTLNGSVVDQTRGLRNGDVITALVTGFGDLGNQIVSSRARVNIGGIDQQVLQVIQTSPGLQNVQFFVNGVTPGQQTLSLSMDGRAAAPAPVTVR